MGDPMGSWTLYPKYRDRAKQRLSNGNSLDYILIKIPFGNMLPISVRDFSPLPVKRVENQDRSISYWLSNEAGLFVDNVWPFTTASDLLRVNQRTKQTLAGIPSFL